MKLKRWVAAWLGLFVLLAAWAMLYLSWIDSRARAACIKAGGTLIERIDCTWTARVPFDHCTWRCDAPK